MSQEPISLAEWKRRAELSRKNAQEKRVTRPGWSPPAKVYLFFVGISFLAAAGIYVMAT